MSEPFGLTVGKLASDLLQTIPFNRGVWQALDVSSSDLHRTYEIRNVHIQYPMDRPLDLIVEDIEPNLPWADLHFNERVSGKPLNPPPSHIQWPWARHNAQHQDEDHKFSHTYPERFWPKQAGRPEGPYSYEGLPGNRGIRFEYGDLSDVVDLLVRTPMTRQAYLPVWFPEDTGAVHRERVPCTLGYHFLITGNKMDCWYDIRSCDLIRHFRDDVYLAIRLARWVAEKVNKANYDSEFDTEAFHALVITPGTLFMGIHSLHAFAGDRSSLEMMSR